MTKYLISFGLGLGLLSFSASVNAEELDESVEGGWNDEDGYFTVNDEGDISTMTEHPPGGSHTVDTGLNSETEGWLRANTTYPDTYHYSRAQIGPIVGDPVGDSGRQYGTGQTTAYTEGHVDHRFSTYWGTP